MKEQNYLDHLVGVFGQPVAENPGVVIQDAAFRALGLERWRYLTLDVDKDQLENAFRPLMAFSSLFTMACASARRGCPASSSRIFWFT